MSKKDFSVKTQFYNWLVQCPLDRWQPVEEKQFTDRKEITIRFKVPDTEDIEKIKGKLKSDISHFDFNTLVPMPPEIADTAMMGSNGEEFYYSQKEWHEHVQDRQDENIFGPIPDIDWVFDNAIDDFTLRRRVKEHDSCWWYDFACLHWGTKWNAYDIEYRQFVTPNKQTKIIYKFT